MRTADVAPAELAVADHVLIERRLDAATLGALTPRETEVLQLVGNGLSNEQIATRLVLSESTVKTHVKRMMSRLGLASRAQGVVLACESGLVVAARDRSGE